MWRVYRVYGCKECGYEKRVRGLHVTGEDRHDQHIESVDPRMTPKPDPEERRCPQCGVGIIAFLRMEEE